MTSYTIQLKMFLKIFQSMWTYFPHDVKCRVKHKHKCSKIEHLGENIYRDWNIDIFRNNWEGRMERKKRKREGGRRKVNLSDLPKYKWYIDYEMLK